MCIDQIKGSRDEQAYSVDKCELDHVPVLLSIQNVTSTFGCQGKCTVCLVKPKRESPQSSLSPHVPVRTPSPSVDGVLSLAPTSTPNPPPPFLSSRICWSQTYDVCLCHSPMDIEEAIRLDSYLENPPCGLRCFLSAVQSSHCWALLITPNFLLDDWCQYTMHQALSEGPMSNRIIPLVLTLPYSQYPKELRFYYYKDLKLKLMQDSRTEHPLVPLMLL
uniref:TIR domain containing adaptor protein n=1 Tax=Oncorhynchus mykiss TaxID=8022 RepID=A0A8K9XXB8_ONCMY